MWHISMYQKHIEFFKKHLKFFMGLETLSIVSCPLGDIPPRDFSIMTLGQRNVCRLGYIIATGTFGVKFSQMSRWVSKMC